MVLETSRAGGLIEPLKRIFMMSWLWRIFAGFYLVAYAFWIPKLFDTTLLVIPILAVTVTLGVGLSLDGFWRATELEMESERPNLPSIQLWQIAGGILLMGYLLVYIPPEGRVVAHWPLDFAITLLSGLVLLAYAVRGERIKPMLASSVST